MNKEQEESLFFYARNDYLIVNNLLVEKIEEASNGYKLAYEDGLNMMKEAMEVGVARRWGVKKEQGQEIYDWYNKRYPDVLDENAIKKALERAKSDFQNIIDCMSPSNEDMVLNRNISTDLALKNYKIGQRIELNTLSSTSINIYEKSFWGTKKFLRYELNVPKGTPMIKMWELPKYITNEPDEVILPPMQVEVRGIKDGNGDCEKIINLDLVKIITVR